jgi:predicted transcriptional regulator
MRNHKEHGNSDILEMTAEIVSSYVNANEIRAENLSDLIRSIHKSLERFLFNKHHSHSLRSSFGTLLV